MKKAEYEQNLKQIENAFIKLKPTEKRLMGYVLQESIRQEEERILNKYPLLKELQKTVEPDTFDYILSVFSTEDVEYIYECLVPLITDKEALDEFTRAYEEKMKKR